MCLCFLVVGKGPVSILPSTVCGPFYVLGKPLVTTLLLLLLSLLSGSLSSFLLLGFSSCVDMGHEGDSEPEQMG